MSVLKVHGVEKSFRSGFWLQKKKILKNIAFEIQPSGVTGFIGVNGSGKTTLLKCLLGLLIPDQGKIEFFSQGELTPALRKKIGFLPEKTHFQNFLTGSEFLDFHGRLAGIPRQQLVEKSKEILSFVGLESAGDVLLKNYSKGMLQRIGIGQAILNEPQFLILDEPMSGLDPWGRHRVKQIIRSIGEKGTPVFFTSHLLFDMEELCEHLLVIDDGQIKYNGRMNDFLDRNVKNTTIDSSEGQFDISSSEEVQEKIDEIRGRGGVIRSVYPNTSNLENDFAQFIEKDQI